MRMNKIYFSNRNYCELLTSHSQLSYRYSTVSTHFEFIKMGFISGYFVVSDKLINVQRKKVFYTGVYIPKK